MSPARLATTFGVSASLLAHRVRAGTIAHVRIGRRGRGGERGRRGHAVRIVPCDWLGDGDGADALRRAFANGRHRLALVDVAPALDVNARTLKRLALRGDFPAGRSSTGRWWVTRPALREWLLAHRVPARAEVELAGVA